MTNKKNFKKIFISMFLFSIFVLIMFFIDYFSKKYFFKFPNKIDFQGPVQHDWKAIGIRSFAHSNSTILSLLHWNIKPIFNYIFTGISIFFVLLLVLFSKSKFLSIFSGILVAGLLGNLLDNIIFSYVRDIIYIPWFDKGTFNLADIFIVFGYIMLFIYFICILFCKKNKDKKK